MTIPTGISHQESVTVDAGNVATAVGSGRVEVFATPMLVALMEAAASRCLEKHLEPGTVTVGTDISIQHSAATPVGMTVTATATVTGADRRLVHFAVSARDETGEVGRGTHTRCVVELEKFMAKARAKGAAKS